MKKFLFVLPLLIGLHVDSLPAFAGQNNIQAKTWEEEYLSDPRCAKWAKDNPEEAAYMKADWEEVQKIKAKPVITNIGDCHRLVRI